MRHWARAVGVNSPQHAPVSIKNQGEVLNSSHALGIFLFDNMHTRVYVYFMLQHRHSKYVDGWIVQQCYCRQGMSMDALYSSATVVVEEKRSTFDSMFIFKTRQHLSSVFGTNASMVFEGAAQKRHARHTETHVPLARRGEVVSCRRWLSAILCSGQLPAPRSVGRDARQDNGEDRGSIPLPLTSPSRTRGDVPLDEKTPAFLPTSGLGSFLQSPLRKKHEIRKIRKSVISAKYLAQQ